MENPKEADDNVSRKEFSGKHFKGTLQCEVESAEVFCFNKEVIWGRGCNFYASIWSPDSRQRSDHYDYYSDSSVKSFMRRGRGRLAWFPAWMI